MPDDDAVTILSALAQPTRLRVAVLLAGASDPGMASGDIAAAMRVPRNLMSTHLAVLTKAGVLIDRRNGRNVAYVMDRRTIRRLGDYLSELAGPPA